MICQQIRGKIHTKQTNTAVINNVSNQIRTVRTVCQIYMGLETSWSSISQSILKEWNHQIHLHFNEVSSSKHKLCHHLPMIRSATVLQQHACRATDRTLRHFYLIASKYKSNAVKKYTVQTHCHVEFSGEKHGRPLVSDYKYQDHTLQYFRNSAIAEESWRQIVITHQ